MSHHRMRARRPGGPATVSSIDTIAQIDDVVRRLEESVCMGALLPGQYCALAELAERYRVRPALLERRLRSGHHADLLRVRDGTVVAVELTYAELRTLHTLHALVRENLFLRSFESLPARRLAQLRTVISAAARTGPDDIGAALVEFGTALIGIQADLCAAGASETELRLLEEIQTASRRYYALGWAQAYGSDISPRGAAGHAQHEMLERWREILTLAGAGRSTRAVELLRRDADQSLRIAQRSLQVDWSTVAGPVGVAVLDAVDLTAAASIARAASASTSSIPVVTPVDDPALSIFSV